jgi:hypothetical protein
VFKFVSKKDDYLIMKILVILSGFFLIWAEPSYSSDCKIESLLSQNPQFCKEDKKEKTELSQSEIRSLFLEVRNDLKEFILAGRRVEQLSNEEKSILSRIQTVEFLGINPNCQPNEVNAVYKRTENGVMICPNLKKFSKQALVSILGHEIGHSADSCSSQCHILHASNRSSLHVPQKLKNPNLPFSLNSLDKSLRESSRPISFVSRGVDQSVYEPWINSNLVEIRAQRMSLARYPLNPIRMCLINNEKLFAGENSIAIPTAAADLESAPGCNQMLDYESTADIWGAFAASRFFKRNPSIKSDQAIYMFEGRKNELCATAKDYSYVKNNINAIWLNTPGIDKALNCKLSEEHTCMRQLPFKAERSQGSGNQNPRPTGSGQVID